VQQPFSITYIIPDAMFTATVLKRQQRQKQQVGFLLLERRMAYPRSIIQSTCILLERTGGNPQTGNQQCCGLKKQAEEIFCYQQSTI